MSIACWRSGFIQTTGKPAAPRGLRDPRRLHRVERSRHACAVRHRAPQAREDRWRLVSTGAQVEDTFESERLARLTVLEVLYTRRKLEPRDPGIFDLDFESVLGQPREHLEFTFWYLLAKNFIKRGDQSRLMITPDGVDYLENHYEANVRYITLPAVS